MMASILYTLTTFASSSTVNSDTMIMPSAPLALPVPAQTPASPLLLSNLSPELRAKLLGWTAGSAGNSECGGYYNSLKLDNSIFSQGGTSVNHNATQISFDQGELSSSSTSVLKGNVVVTQVNRQLSSDLALLYPNVSTTANQKIKEVDLYGHVQIIQPGRLLIGQNAHYDLEDKTGTMAQALYRMDLNEDSEGILDKQTISSEGQTLTQTIAWGQSTVLNQLSPSLFHLKNSSFTTCSPLKPSWHLHASSLDLDKQTGRGEAYNAWLIFEGVPIFYSPYFNFPLDNRRKTGFLYPTIGYSTTKGLDLALPFYLNLAANYDAIISPELMSLHGVLTHGKFRYLTTTSSGQLNLGFIPNDRGFQSFQQSALTDFGSNAAPSNQAELAELENASTNRAAISWQNNTYFDENWSSTIDYNYVTDPYYLNDFGGSFNQQLTNQLLQQVTLNYSDPHWNMLGNIQGYQTLHMINQANVNNIYSRLPQLVATGNYLDLPGGADFTISSEYVNFWGEPNPGDVESPAEGQRLNIQPGISLPVMVGLSGYVTPRLQVQATQYELSNAGVPNPAAPIGTGNEPFTNTNPSRVTPIFDIDSGLFFDRQVNWFDNNYRQTLEPRVFYLYVPYQNQQDIPLFDTSLQAFDFNQLFQTNRFAGNDRISDANQVSLALTTRFLNEDTGQEKASASIGQIVYFRNREVTLCQTPGCSDAENIIGVVPTDTPTSPIAGQLSYAINDRWKTSVNLAWDPNTHETDNANLNFHFGPDAKHLINLGYSFLRNGDTLNGAPGGSTLNNFNQPYVSFAWPLMNNWSTIGYLDYNLSHGHDQQFYYGLQYDSCCWSVRMIASRSFSNLDQNNNPVFTNTIYLQLLLRGLGSIGNANPDDLLQAIGGYQDPFAKQIF